ncbi:MAG: hypothetical protein WDA28_13240 [Castellaniella sp.]
MKLRFARAELLHSPNLGGKKVAAAAACFIFLFGSMKRSFMLGLLSFDEASLHHYIFAPT